MAAQRRKKAEGFGPPPIDPEEEAALQRAIATLHEHAPNIANGRAVTQAVISAWIIERVRLSVPRIMCGKLAYGLGDSHLRGSLEAVLPEVGAALTHLPADKPFFELTKDQVVDVLAVGFQAGRESGALLNDEIPF